MTDPAAPVYLVLGATGGIGSVLSRRLSARNAKLALAARSGDSLAALAGELNAFAAPIDAGSFSSVETLAMEAKERFGRLDGIANCVGSLLLKPAHLTREEEWQQVLAANLTSAFSAVRAGGKALSEGGSIVLVSSAAARIGLANHEAIAAAKAGVIGLTLSAAATYASRGLRVNCVAPGLVRTPLTARLTASEAALKASTSLHPLGRAGEPAEVAEVIDWLLGPSSSWVTGQVIGVDGGLATVRTK